MLDGNLRPGKNTFIIELEKNSLGIISALLHKYIDIAEDCEDKTQAILTLEHLALQTDCSDRTALQGGQKIILPNEVHHPLEDLYLGIGY